MNNNLLDTLSFKHRKRVDWKQTEHNVEVYMAIKWPDLSPSEWVMTYTDCMSKLHKFVKKHGVFASYEYIEARNAGRMQE